MKINGNLRFQSFFSLSLSIFLLSKGGGEKEKNSNFTVQKVALYDDSSIR